MTNSNVLTRVEIAEKERELGLPEDVEAFYEEQRKKYDEWSRTVWFSRNWSFQEETCSHCGRAGMTVTAANLSVCILCLQTGIAWYPTGRVQPNITDLIARAQRYTSQSL